MLARNYPEQWRSELGARVLKAADAHDAMQKCGFFLSTGDYTWCGKAMPREASPGYKALGNIREYHVSGADEGDSHPQSDAFVGLSFGIRATDPWSELMSGLYHMRTELFDCYYDGSDGPMAQDMHGNHSPAAPCTKRKCYSEAYHANKVCLDGSSGLEGLFTSAGRQYQSLSTSLRDRGPLSTFLKMDIEGSEWATLERLLESKEDMAKIRTLDMEVHMNMDPRVRQDHSEGIAFEHKRISQETLTRHVEVMERLAQAFAVTGSTLDHGLAQVVHGLLWRRSRDAGFVAPPAHVVTENGLSLDQYCISFVNRDLL